MFYIYSMKNPKFTIEYLYRDAGNYKIYCKAEIENPNHLTLPEFEKWFKSVLIDNLYFNPTEFGLPKPQFSMFDYELDHEWCEFILLREENQHLSLLKKKKLKADKAKFNPGKTADGGIYPNSPFCLS